MKRSPVIVVGIAALMVVGATVCAWRYLVEWPSSSRLDVTHKRSATKSGAHSDDRSGNQVTLVFKDPVRALFEMYGAQQHVDAGTQAPIEETLAKSPGEPSIFNVDAVAMGPHAYEIAVDPDMLDPPEEVELTNSDSMSQAPGSAVNGLSDNAAHNEQILQGKVMVEDQSIGPKEVDPDTHPPTD